jgi:hypothetical protein
MESIENYLIGEVFQSDMYSTTYEAYDKLKKCWCYIEIPNVKTSWDYIVH